VRCEDCTLVLVKEEWSHGYFDAERMLRICVQSYPICKPLHFDSLVETQEFRLGELQVGNGYPVSSAIPRQSAIGALAASPTTL
jgi:hypothetical protein